MKITICGSSRFMTEIDKANRQLSMVGHVVYSLVPLLQTPNATQKQTLREIHRNKIDASDAIFVVSIGGYIGADTAAEIEYARRQGKPIMGGVS